MSEWCTVCARADVNGASRVVNRTSPEFCGEEKDFRIRISVVSRGERIMQCNVPEQR